MHHLKAGCPDPAEKGRAEAKESKQCACPAEVSHGREEAREVSMGRDDTNQIICLFPPHLLATEGREREQLPRALKSPLNCKTSASCSDLTGLLLFFSKIPIISR